MSGQVILVGAGPGDPGLLTRRGEQALRRADVVVYDRLIGEELLQLVPPEAERIYVGKAASRHTMPQEEINELLLRKAREGKRVVRLKGGDPFLFGRGGEELELLVQNGVPFEVVPGVTSALAAPAWAGIPVTHRAWASSVHIVTGHPQAGGKASIPYEALVQAGGTLVFLMGVGALGDICAGLQQAGMRPDTPAAMVENGTRPNQRKVAATLADLPEQARNAGLHSPSVIVVGEVVSCAEHYDWAIKLPLRGKKVIVTRPAERAEGLVSALTALGCEVRSYPCIGMVSRADQSPLRAALNHLDTFDTVAFTSPEGVKVFWNVLWGMGLDSRALAGVRLAAIGPATAAALEQHGLRAEFVPEQYDSAALAHGLAEMVKRKVLIPRAAMGTAELGEILTARGVPFEELPVYDTEYPARADSALLRWLAEGCAVTFTSVSTVEGFGRSLPEGCDLSRVTGVCIGTRTEQAAKALGLATVCAAEATEAGVLEALRQLDQE